MGLQACLCTWLIYIHVLCISAVGTHCQGYQEIYYQKVIKLFQMTFTPSCHLCILLEIFITWKFLSHGILVTAWRADFYDDNIYMHLVSAAVYEVMNNSCRNRACSLGTSMLSVKLVCNWHVMPGIQSSAFQSYQSVTSNKWKWDVFSMSLGSWESMIKCVYLAMIWGRSYDRSARRTICPLRGGKRGVWCIVGWELDGR